MNKILLLLSVLFVVSCSKDAEPIKYTLTTTVSPADSGTINPNGGTVDEGQQISVTAAPAAEYVFDKWTGAASGSDKTVSVTMDSDKSVTANFVKKKYALTTSVEGEGTIAEKVIKTGATDYNSGTIVELTATAKAGWGFKEWSGDLTGTENPKEITIDKAKTVKAVFEEQPLIGTWTLTNEEWVGSGSWPDGQSRGCWKSGDEGSPDQFIFNPTTVTKKVWECNKDGKLDVDLVTYGPINWSDLGGGNYDIGGETKKVTFENNNQTMKLPFDSDIIQTWTK
mgnify:FL=1